jgi:hypothetical protein
MATLKEFRQQYPEYDSVPDGLLASKLHKAYYSDMSFNDFAEKIQLFEKPKEEGIIEGFVKPTLKAIPKVAGTAAAGLVGMPVSGLVGAGVGTMAALEGHDAWDEASKAMQGVSQQGSLTTTPQEQQGLENLMLATKPFQMAGEGWQHIGRTSGIPYAEPVLGTMGEAAAMFGLPAGVARARGAIANPVRSMESNLSVMARDMMPDAMKPVTIPDEVMATRGVLVGEPYGEPTKTTPEPLALPTPEERAALPSGQGFELVDKSRIDDYYDALSESVSKEAGLTKAEKEELLRTTEAERKAALDKWQTDQETEAAGTNFTTKDIFDRISQDAQAQKPISNKTGKSNNLVNPETEIGTLNPKQNLSKSETLFSGVDPTQLGTIADKIGNSKIGKAVIEFFSPGSTIPQGKDWMYARQEAMGGTARGENIAEKFVNHYKGLSPEERTQIWNYMDGRIPLEQLPPNLQTAAQRMRMIDNTIGKRLADEGVISSETYEANKGKHIRYIYNIYQQGQGLLGSGGARLNTKPFSERNPWGLIETKKYLKESYNYLPKDELQALGGFLDGVVEKADLPQHNQWIADKLMEKKAEFAEIEQMRTGLIKDPVQAMAQSIVEGEKAVSMSKYFKKIGENQNWVYEPSVLKINGLKMGIGKAQSILDAMKEVGELNPLQLEYKGKLESALAESEAKMGQHPKGFIQLNGKSYGDIDGMYVNKTIAQDIRPIFGLGEKSSSELINGLKEASVTATGLWKMKNVALNIPTMARNVVSNNIQLLMSGMGPHELTIKVPEAIYGLIKKDQDWNALMKQGAFKTNFATSELAELVEIAKTVKDSDNIISLVSNMQKLGKFYGKIDDVFKLAIFKQLRGEGVSTAEAAREAIKWGMDYSLAHPSIKALRNIPLGSPFFTYQYKIAPLIVESIRKRPWVVGGIASLPWIVQKTITKDMTDEDARKYIQSLPEYVQDGQVFLIPGTHGMNALDLSYMLPWGNWYQVGSSARHGKATKAFKELGISQGLIPTIAFAAITGKDLFTGKDIIDDLEKHDPKEVAWALTKYAWQTAMPPMLSQIGVVGKVYEHEVHGQTKTGLKTEAMNAYPRIVGANIYPVDPMGRQKQDMMDIKNVKKALLRSLYDRNITPEQKRKVIELYKKSIVDIKEQ